jgi:hypothetical protein
LNNLQSLGSIQKPAAFDLNQAAFHLKKGFQ